MRSERTPRWARKKWRNRKTRWTRRRTRLKRATQLSWCKLPARRSSDERIVVVVASGWTARLCARAVGSRQLQREPTKGVSSSSRVSITCQHHTCPPHPLLHPGCRSTLKYLARWCCLSQPVTPLLLAPSASPPHSISRSVSLSPSSLSVSLSVCFRLPQVPSTPRLRRMAQ